MKRQQWVLLFTALCLMAGTAVLLARVTTHQRLSPPGVKTHPTADPKRLEVDLPEKVLDYKSEQIEVDELTKRVLPSDTSFGERRYQSPDGFGLILNVVLMGADRTSLHKPQFCLEGQGYHIDQGASMETTVHIDQPVPYELPVVRLVSTKEMEIGGQRQLVRGIYVYWFVAEDALSAGVSGFQRMWLMGANMLRTGVLQRWAYVSCLSLCAPGQEEATLARMKEFIAASVPEFQLTPKGPVSQEAARK